MKNHVKDKHLQWNAVAKYQLTILPESIATITAVSQGAPNEGTMYLEGVGLKWGSDSFIQVPDGLVELDTDNCFQVKIANTTNWRIIFWPRELLGRLSKADTSLKTAASMMPQELRAFKSNASHLATLVSKLDALDKANTVTRLAPDGQAQQYSTVRFSGSWGDRYGASGLGS
jgi:hypothetical protein